ncbi:hypothetical protein ISN45_Aa02g024520 [Arabidopsis thaliana x Arabidopsis arenosa]|uniref:Uncharacterized protein n=1 Tax=Arabidopsis thaliana x Arabidopsis arenosa TaxID=1240361 RepID=A0A8T2BLK6_9BRAS|nr:hypothetical protein ISN45_Aa02g024520 [Arabidopsis thaliana x Arabidopsis arenosa]
MDGTSSSGAHVRSTSWSEDVNPLSRAIEDHLLILKKKPESARRKLGVLKNLYEVVEVFLRFQTTKTQKSFTGFEDVSDGFIEVLDICSTIRDVLMEIKEQVRELESSLRRRLIRSKSGEDQEAFVARELDAYVFKRRALSRTIVKQLKKTEDKMRKKKRDCGDVINVMKRVEKTSFDVLVSLLIQVVTKDQRDDKKRSRRGIVSRVFKKKNQEVDADELKKLRETEHEIEETERELECVYKKLLKTRVTFLNMLTL